MKLQVLYHFHFCYPFKKGSAQINHMCRKVLNIGFVCVCVWGGGGGGGGGGQGSEYWGGGGQGGAKLFADCKLIGAPAPSQCQITQFLTL